MFQIPDHVPNHRLLSSPGAKTHAGLLDYEQLRV